MAASKSKNFRIPTLEEMENVDTEKEESEPSFKKGKLQSRTSTSPSPSSAHASHSAQSKDKTAPSASSRSEVVGSLHTMHSSAYSSKPAVSQRLDPGVDSLSCRGSDASESGNSVDVHGNSNESVASKPSASNSLLVNPRQRGNPILKSVRNIPWEYSTIVPDYVMGQGHCALYLSLRYHQLHPNYIHERLKHLGRSYDLRVLLVQVDLKECHHLLKGLAKICLLSDCTLILAFSTEEAGRYLETYKIFEHKPPEAIMEKTDNDYLSKFTDCLTRVKSVNKTDCATLLTAFGNLGSVMDASKEDLSLCPGFGPQKARRLHSIFHEPFLRSAATATSTATATATADGDSKQE